jgi:hypothetical protein
MRIVQPKSDLYLNAYAKIALYLYLCKNDESEVVS